MTRHYDRSGEPLPKHSEQTSPGVAKDLLTFADLRALGVPWSRSHLYRLVAARRFPRPIATGDRPCDTKLWRRSDYEHWLNSLQPAATSTTNQGE